MNVQQIWDKVEAAEKAIENGLKRVEELESKLESALSKIEQVESDFKSFTSLKTETTVSPTTNTTAPVPQS